jgi:hypothetical protein
MFFTSYKAAKQPRKLFLELCAFASWRENSKEIIDNDL